jgi:hypothetical protein
MSRLDGETEWLTGSSTLSSQLPLRSTDRLSVGDLGVRTLLGIPQPHHPGNKDFRYMTWISAWSHTLSLAISHPRSLKKVQELRSQRQPSHLHSRHQWHCSSHPSCAAADCSREVSEPHRLPTSPPLALLFLGLLELAHSTTMKQGKTGKVLTARSHMAVSTSKPENQGRPGRARRFVS